ncbi:MAG: response regulator [Blautia sp.]
MVDDEQELLKMVSDILKDAGFETVLTAMTVKEAILTAKEETPDLIVLDVMSAGWGWLFSDAAFPHFYQCADHFLNSKGRSGRQIIGIGAWCR